ncbi:MAG: cache domain-containing protein [Proteobacteria bacterium]|nr:cache domain-containing protein [Pseudomonadota bacterium]
MSLNSQFKSGLFRRIIATTTITRVALFAIMYLLAVPFIQSTIESIEHRSARTILDNVYDTVEHIQHSLENNRQTVLLARKTTLRDIVAVVESRASWLEQQARTGKLTRDQAKSMLLEEIRKIRYGNGDYVWASDYRSVLVAHPDQKLNNSDFSQQRDTRGNLIVPPMVAGALATGEGYYSYWWRRLGDQQPIEKLSFYKHLPAFELVIGTGLYLDDIDATINRQRGIAIDELRSQLRKTRLGETGYVYIFDSHGFMLIHPNANIETKTFADATDPATGKPLAPMLAAVADKPEGLRYKWDRPDDPGNYIYDKISWVRHFPGLDWYICTSVYVDELDDSARTVRNRALLIFGIALLISLVQVYFFVKGLFGPLKQLSDTALSIGKGDLDARCPLKRDDEFGVLADAFNGMVDRLRDNIQNLDAKVSERTAELETANRELRQLDQTKSDFISTVSHELRTPMTSIVGFAKLAKKKLDDVVLPQVGTDKKAARAASQVSSNLDIIVTESERLSLLINDVMDMATLDAGKVEWQLSPVAAAHLLECTATTTQGLADIKGLALSWQVEPNLPEISGDEIRLRQVLVNLISNAVKFTEIGQITLRAERQEGCIRFCVQDTGIGIAPENQGKVFDRFRQIGDTLTDKPQGTGLGLSICRQIVEHHGGKIWIESEPGKGSTFYFTIPCAAL